MPQNPILRIVGALLMLTVVAAIWYGSGAFFRWASAPPHTMSED